MKLGIGLLAAVLLLLSLLQPAWSDNAKDIMDMYIENRNYAQAKINVYLEKLESKGTEGLLENVPGLYAKDVTQERGPCWFGCRVFDVIHIPQEDGTTKSEPQVLSDMEVAVRAGVYTDAHALNQAGGTLLNFQSGVNSQIGGPDITTVLNNLATAPNRKDSEADIIMPTHMFAAGGMMFIVAASGINEAEDSLANSAERAKATNTKNAKILSQLQAVGPKTVNGYSTMHYRAANLQAPAQSSNSQDFVPTSTSIWIDVEKYVAVKHRVEGLAIIEGESRDFYIEVENSDFRTPAGCGDMYEPYHRTMRMGGILNDKEMVEMQEARVQLEEFDKQMAALPANQREMMENMVGGQMATIRGLANNGAFESVEEIEEIFCNPDLKALFGPPGPTDPDELLRDIQSNLTILGYEPGNTDGVLDVMTQVAISQYQSEHGFTVTGEPSQSLLSQLIVDVAEN